jgi:hypothetical protein
MIVKCKICFEEFKTFPYYTKKGQGIYCSSDCYGVALREHIPWNKGKRMTVSYRKKVSDSLRGKCRENSRRWKGGRCNNGRGYITILISGKRVPEHRYVMENHLKRKLTSSEIVHHINRNGSDNKIENLIIMTRAEHASFHHPANQRTRSCIP